MTRITLPNMYADVWRSQHEVSGTTDAATPYIYRLEGHMTRIKDSQLMRLATTGLKGTYEYYCDTDIDIRIGDIFKNFIRKDTGMLWYEVAWTETWRVVDVENSSPGFMEYKDIVLDRIIAGGPAPT